MKEEEDSMIVAPTGQGWILGEHRDNRQTFRTVMDFKLHEHLIILYMFDEYDETVKNAQCIY